MNNVQRPIPQRILITAALPYANGDIHLGHLAGAYLPADLYARYQRLKGREVLFLCGSDEHGVPITVTAEQEHTTPQSIVDRYHQRNQAAFEAFGMSFDNYSRTSIPLHHRTAQSFFTELYRRGILKSRTELQLYCEHDRMFLADRYVEGTCPRCGFAQARGDQCEQCGTWLNQIELRNPVCKLCGSTPVVRETTHLYFPLGAFQERLEAYVRERDQRDGWKPNVLQYCASWFKEGLQDRAVTRDLSWGVPVPVEGFESKVLYVWFDAVLGYISSAMEWAERRGTPEAWREFWQRDGTKYVAFIGKDNVVFHCIVFPAMLMAWNDAHREQYVLPENVPANEFLNFEGQKFSKSRGWGIDVQDFLRFFPADVLRYALAVTLPEYRDSDFALRDFQARTNNELADILGNFVNRTLSFAHRNFQGTVPQAGTLRPEDAEMLRRLATYPALIGEHFEHYRFRDGVQEAMNLARAGNKYFNDQQPWKTLKTDRERCATTISVCLQMIRTLGVVVAPVVPGISRKIMLMLGLRDAPGPGSWEDAGTPMLVAGSPLGPQEVLVNKILDEDLKKMKDALAPPPPPSERPAPQEPSLISLDDFRKIDLRVARIVEASAVPKSDKLLRLTVELGTETRQLVAGIGRQYRPEQLLGRLVVVVANLQPAKLMGLESRGMLLAANADGGGISLVTVAEECATGSIVR